jgi:hypothetical protein
MRKTLIAGAAVLALTFGVAACGSDDSNEDALTNAELVKQADQICTDFSEKFTTLQEESGLDNQSSKEDVVAFISDDIVPLYEDELSELRELTPSEEDADAYNDMLDTLESEVNEVAEDPEAAMSSEDPFAGSRSKAAEFGLEKCGQ